MWKMFKETLHDLLSEWRLLSTYTDAGDILDFFLNKAIELFTLAVIILVPCLFVGSIVFIIVFIVYDVPVSYTGFLLLSLIIASFGSVIGLAQLLAYSNKKRLNK